MCIYIYGTPPKTHILYENYVHLHLPLTKHSCTSLWNLYFPNVESCLQPLRQASLSYPVAPSWASGRIGGGHTLSLLRVVSAGLYRLRALLSRWAALGHSQSVCCAHSLWREAGVLLVVGAFVHSQSALRTHRMVGGRGVGSALSLRRASASAHAGGKCFLCAPFSMSAVFSLWVHLCTAARAGGGPGACSMPALAAWVGAPLSIPVAAPNVVWEWLLVLWAGASSILLEDSMQALFGGPLAWGVAACSWLGGVESCLQPLRQARPFPTPWLHRGPRGGLGVGTPCRCFVLFRRAYTPKL